MSFSTAHFHVENNMDFNKWISDGVPYISQQQYEQRLQARKLLNLVVAPVLKLFSVPHSTT